MPALERLSPEKRAVWDEVLAPILEAQRPVMEAIIARADAARLATKRDILSITDPYLRASVLSIMDWTERNLDEVRGSE